MYARFDIVWPDPGDESDLRIGVDALAFGLGTLAMSGGIFGPKVRQNPQCHHCSHDPSGDADRRAGRGLARRKVDNYAQFTRKFSLGNGPSKFVQSYYISTESGKMLGTLVALALSRMRNLESFVWDMPTGIIREAWEALSSLGRDFNDNLTSSKLESIWIRCHDSKEVRAPSQNLHFFLASDSLSARYDLLRDSFRQIEHPNFSILPPLKSISVLQVDQIAYFEELSILLLNSLSCLRELRIGISKHSELAREHVREDSNDAEATFLNESSLTSLGANGVLGMLMSKFCQCYRQRVIVPDDRASGLHVYTSPYHDPGAGITGSSIAPPIPPLPIIVPGVPIDLTSTLPEPASLGQAPPVPHHVEIPVLRPAATPVSPVHSPPQKPVVVRKGNDQSDRDKNVEHEHAKASKERFEKRLEDPLKQMRLKLRLLAFENVPLSISILTRVLDWKLLTDITLLHCNSDEKLWRALAMAFPPQLKDNAEQSSTKTISTHDFPLRLRRIHTDGVSSALISFLRENLAPNTLECLFLQDRKEYKPSARVTIDTIYKGPLRRHRESLQKLSIDSAWKHQLTGGSWKKWLLNRDVLTFITSGKMSNLRELAVSVEYKDWVRIYAQRFKDILVLTCLALPLAAPPRPSPSTLSLCALRK
jgi:hypothetical protein